MNLNFKIILKSLLYKIIIDYNFKIITFNYKKLIIVTNSYLLFFADQIIINFYYRRSFLPGILLHAVIKMVANT